MFAINISHQSMRIAIVGIHVLYDVHSRLSHFSLSSFHVTKLSALIMNNAIHEGCRWNTDEQ